MTVAPARARTISALVRPVNETYPGAWFYASTPRVMAVQGEHRDHTRLTASPTALRDDWHSLNLTEFLCCHAGPFEPATLYELAAVLCRFAPTWEGTLNVPSPLHLAKAIVLDHPGNYLSVPAEDDVIPAG